MVKPTLLHFAPIAFFIISCTQPVPDGHYHLEWRSAGSPFQTWNIKDNAIWMGGVECEYPDNCLCSEITYKYNKMIVTPWVDIVFDCLYEKDNSGTIWMYSGDDTLKLAPHENCTRVADYLFHKTKHLTDTFKLLPDLMHGTAVFPENRGNEMIVGSTSEKSSFYLFNDALLSPDSKGEFQLLSSNSSETWLYVENNMNVQEVVPIIKTLYNQGQSIQNVFIIQSENNEQVGLVPRKIKSIRSDRNNWEIEYCGSC